MKNIRTYFDAFYNWRLAQKFASSTKRVIQKTFEGVGEETNETKQMALSFFKLLDAKLDLKNRKEPPTPEEVKAAIEQLKDVGRLSVFATVSILPGGGFSMFGLEILARKFGVKGFTFVPSAFRQKNRKQGIELVKMKEN